MIKTEATKNLG